ncbi:hypothetical protein ACSQ67_025584 [Phaseolus vulgaris]
MTLSSAPLRRPSPFLSSAHSPPQSSSSESPLPRPPPCHRGEAPRAGRTTPPQLTARPSRIGCPRVSTLAACPMAGGGLAARWGGSQDSDEGSGSGDLGLIG